MSFIIENNTIMQYTGEADVHVVIPSHIKKIGYRAFKDAQIRGLTLNEGLVEIEDEAFAYNYIPSLIIPASLKKIGSKAFSNCNITDLSFNVNEASITEHNTLRCLRTAGGIVNIGEKAFINNKINHNITFPHTLRELNRKAFYNNYIPSVILSKQLKIVGDYAFTDNPLSKVTLTSMDSLEYMGYMAMGRDTDNIEINFKED